MDLGLRGKAFVAGGSTRGLGRAVAEQLVAEGARVLVVSRSEEAVARTVAELGENAFGYAADLSDPDAAEAVATAAVTLGELDGLLVNAGGPPPGMALELGDAEWRGAFELLIAGPIRLIRALTPQMRDGGSILFITSSSVRQPIPNLDSSNVLRPGVAALAKTLALQLAPRLRVNTIAPGRLDTDRVRALDEGRARERGITFEEQRAETLRAIPLGRLGDPAEFGRVAAFLLSPAASYVSGISVQVDGAMVTAVP